MTHILKKQDPNISPVADLFDVLSHAAHLDAIISYVTGTKVEALQEAHSSYEKLTNLNIASNHFLQTFPDATPASSSAILARNPKATLDFVWTLFYHSQLKRAQYCGLHDRFAILLWCQHTVATSPMVVTISDFLQSFSDGIALCAIVESFHPNALDLQDLSPIHKTDNLRKAFDAIEKHFGIPKLLSPLDVISETPDEISIIVYLTLIFKHCTEK